MNTTAVMLSKTSITNLAEKVAKEIGYDMGDDILPAITALGGEVLFRDFWLTPERHSHSLLVRDHADFTIWAPSSVMPPRLRFEIAHNLGHYVLHFLWNRHIGKNIGTLLFVDHHPRDEDNKRMDFEANWFAMSFIAPKDRFTGVWRRHRGDLYGIEKETGLSGYFANLRAKGLGLSSDLKEAA